jgi:glyoxylase-like metal-dependent hydrolase (beta-lactamase superfamily II)
LEIAPGIHRIQTPLGDRFVCLFLLVGEEATLLVDTGVDSTPREHLTPYLDSLDLPSEAVRYVLTSHADFDHTGGNASARELLPGARFICHRLDQSWVEDIDRMIDERYCEFQADHGIGEDEESRNFIRGASRHVPTDMTLVGGERVRLSPQWQVEILHTPGHTRGHLSVYDAESETLIIADAALYNAVLRTDGEPAFPPTYRYLDTYLSTLGCFQAMKVRTLLTSHYPVYSGEEVAEFLGESRAFADRLDGALRKELERASAPRTMKELVDVLAAKSGNWPEATNDYLAFPLCGHLERMVRHRLVETDRREERVTYQWRD